VLLAMLFITRKDLLEEAKIHKNNHCISNCRYEEETNLKPKDFIKTILMVLIWIGFFFITIGENIVLYYDFERGRGGGVRRMRTLISATKPWQVP
jgi:hypothetical protein